MWCTYSNSIRRVKIRSKTSCDPHRQCIPATEIIERDHFNPNGAVYRSRSEHKLLSASKRCCEVLIPPIVCLKARRSIKSGRIGIITVILHRYRLTAGTFHIYISVSPMSAAHTIGCSKFKVHRFTSISPQADEYTRPWFINDSINC